MGREPQKIGEHTLCLRLDRMVEGEVIEPASGVVRVKRSQGRFVVIHRALKKIMTYVHPRDVARIIRSWF